MHRRHRRTGRKAGVAALLCWLLVPSAACLAGGGAATWSFGAGTEATCPQTISVKGARLAVDLSALPEGARVFRAVLRFERQRLPGWQREGDEVVVVPAGSPDRPLALLGPRYTSLDATAAVVRALADGKGKLELLVKSLSGWRRERTRLDVSFTGGKPKNRIPKVTGLRARHREGQTLLTWTEPDPPLKAEDVTFKQWRELWKKPPPGLRRVRYRIYRSTRPISAATIAQAVLVDEVPPLTCWNAEFHGISPDPSWRLLRYVVEDGAAPVPPGTGIYAHNPPSAGSAYYAVSCAVNGEEDLGSFDAANALAKPVAERVGPGRPILQRTEKPEKFFYTKGITLHYFTRWEAPPRCNLPSRPFDYLVIIPEKLTRPAPLNLILHCWGSNLYGKGGAYSWFGWKDKARGVGVASNQIPYDWWTCYHENRGTWKPWTSGVTRNFTPKRLLAFVEWVGTKWPVDKTRICVSGESMGGSGSTFMPIRYGDVFAYAYSAVGIHNPAAIKGGGFYESYARVCGRMEAKIKHESGMLTFEYLNDPLLVRTNPRANLPFIGFGNGKNDAGIGWPHVVDLARALQAARQPHAVIWNMRGHGAGTFYPRIDFRTDQSLPAFTNCSLDDDIGTARRLGRPKPATRPDGSVIKNHKGKVILDRWDGDSQGQINYYLRWKTDDLVDEPTRWQITVYLTSGRRGAPKDACTVDVTPRRLRRFRVRPGMKFKWTNQFLAGDRPPQSGSAEADRFGLVTMKGVIVTKGNNRLTLTPAG